MKFSAELRWFWQDAQLTQSVERWFTASGQPGGGSTRSDVYLVGKNQLVLGIKERGGNPGHEVKGLIQRCPPVSSACFHGEVEVWGKWLTEVLSTDARFAVTTRKTRLLRKLSLDEVPIREVPLGPDEKPLTADDWPTIGCNVEFTKVLVDGRTGDWSTLGFEAFGPLEVVDTVLRRAVDHLRYHAPDLSSAEALSYPGWLAKHAVP